MADNVSITAGAGTTIATDDAGAGGHVQLVKLAISTDGSATLIPAEATNGLDVDVTRSALPTGAATEAELDTQTGILTTIDTDTGGILTAVQLIDDTVATLGTDTYTEATTKGTTIGAVRRDADTTLVGTTNEIGPLQMDANGRLKVEAFSGETLPVSGTVTANAGTGTLAVSLASLPALVAGSANIGDVDIASVPAPLSTTGGGTEATAHRVTIANDSTGVLSVDDNGGTLTVDGTVTASNAAGDIAHDAADSGNPIKIGGKAAVAVPTAVAAADRVNSWFDLNGRNVMVQIADTATLSNVSGSASSVTVLASNTGRKGAIVVNDSDAVCYLKFGSTASATSYTFKMFKDTVLTVPFGYTGILTGIWDSAVGSARVTEIT